MERSARRSMATAASADTNASSRGLRRPSTTSRSSEPSSERSQLGLSKRMSTLLPEEIDVIVPSFDAHRRVGGGFSPLLTAKVDRWLRSHVSNPKKLLKVLSEPTTAEQQAGA